MHEYLSIVRLTCTISTQALSATNQFGPRAPNATKSPRDKEISFLSEEYNLHMYKRSSSRWLLVSVQGEATLIKRNDSFIHDTKKSNVIADISRCYSFKSGQRGKFPFHKRVAAILRHSEKFWHVIESRVLLKKKEDRKPPVDPDLSYPTLSSGLFPTYENQALGLCPVFACRENPRRFYWLFHPDRPRFWRLMKTRLIDIPGRLGWSGTNLENRERLYFPDASKISAMVGDHSR